MKTENKYTIVKDKTIQKVTWTSKDIAELLTQIESEVGFRGFLEIYFEAGSFPTIKYLLDANYKNNEENTDKQ